MRKFFAICLACLLMPLASWAIDDGSYYLYNVGAGMYMNQGGNPLDDATANYMLCLKKQGEAYTIASLGDGTYSIACPLTNGTFLGADGNTKTSAAAPFTLTAKEDGTYTISNGEAYVGYSGEKGTTLSTTMVKMDCTAEDGDNIKWQLISVYDLVARLESAKANNPVDATFYVPAPNANRHSSYLASSFSGNVGNGYCTGYQGNNEYFIRIGSANVGSITTASLSLKVKPGKYSVNAQAVYEEVNAHTGAIESAVNYGYFYANTDTIQVKGIYDESAATDIFTNATKNSNNAEGKYYPTIIQNDYQDACAAFDNDMYHNTIANVVVGEDSILNIGFYVTADAAKYSNLVFDNVTLDYYGPVPPVADGSYYIYNTEAKKFWGAGNSWGTQASLVEHGELVTLTVGEDGTYTMDTYVANGGDNHYFNGSYMDGAPAAATPLTIAKTADGKYTFSNGDAVYGWDGSTTVLSATATGANAEWEILTKADYLAKVEAATVDNPVDATSFILDPGFGRNNRNQSAWTIVASNKNMSGGNNTNNCAESYHSTFDLSQTIEGVPNGVYALTAQAFYRQDGSDNDNLPYFYINDAKAQFGPKTGSENNMSAASVSFAAGQYKVDPMIVKVENGTITLGAKNEANTSLWCIWDNFELTYYGADATIEAVEAAAYKDTYVAAYESAAAVDQTANIDPVSLAALQAALETYKSETVLANPTKDQLIAATEALDTATKNAKASIANGDALKAMKTLMDNTNVYGEEAYATYKSSYEDYLAKFNEGTLTETVVNPNSATNWHASTAYNFLLTPWTIGGEAANNFDKALYINTWSVEGNTDGSEFKVPFFEYWTGDANSLGENTIQAKVTGLKPGKYDITTWTRVRVKNNVTDAPYGISLTVNGGDTVQISGTQVGTSQMYLDHYTATGVVGEDSVLTITYNVAADNNISWLSYKDVMYTFVPSIVKTVEARYEDYSSEYPNYPDEDWGMVSGAKFNVDFYDDNSLVIRNWMNQNVDLCVNYDADGTVASVNNPGGTPSYWAYADNQYYAWVACKAYNYPSSWVDESSEQLSLTFSWGQDWTYYHLTWAEEPAKVYTLDYTYTSKNGAYYEAATITVDMDSIVGLAGAPLSELKIYAVQPDGTLDSNYKLGTTDGWRNAEGAWQSWGASAYFYSKADFSLETAQVYELGGYPGNTETEEGSEFVATYAFVNETTTDTVFVNIHLVYPAVEKVEFTIVKEFDINHTELPGVAYSEAEAAPTFDVAAVCEALGVEDLSNVTAYIVNVTTGEFKTNSTDGWRDENGDAAQWGSATNGFCLKLNDPTSGEFDYTGAHDANFQQGDTYLAKWAIVNEKNEAVVLNVNVLFSNIPNVYDIDYTYTSKNGAYYEAATITVDMDSIVGLAGAPLSELSIYAVQPDGTLDSNYKLGTTDGWRNAEGAWQSWGASAYFYSKADFSLETAQIYELGGYPGNTEAEEGSEFVATYAFVNDATYNAYLSAVADGTWDATQAVPDMPDTVLVNIHLVYPAAEKAEYTVVKTIEVEHIEKPETAYSEAEAAPSFDVSAVCEALGVDDLSNVTAYIVNVTTGEFKSNTTDGWRDENGDAAQWGSATNGFCLKLNDPTSGEFDYTGAHDANFTESDTYVAKWALVNDKNEAVVLNVTVKFSNDYIPVSISGLANDANSSKNIYNANGQKLNKIQKGLNIINGKKVYIK